MSLIGCAEQQPLDTSLTLRILGQGVCADPAYRSD